MKCMKLNLIFTLFFLLALAFSSCDNDDTKVQSVVFETDFNSIAATHKSAVIATENLNADGWSPVFAEYPDGEGTFYELASGLKNLPEPLDQTKKGFMLSGNNHSDALQMFLMKQLTGLEAKTKYTVETEVDLASKYPDGSVGIGGSPGNAVHLVSKFAMNGFSLDNVKGDNIKLVTKKEEGNPLSTIELELGDVSLASEEYVYKLISRNKSSDSNVVMTDQNGKLWVVVGTWSGFEGITTLYYTRIKITLTKV